MAGLTFKFKIRAIAAQDFLAHCRNVSISWRSGGGHTTRDGTC